MSLPSKRHVERFTRFAGLTVMLSPTKNLTLCFLMGLMSLKSPKFVGGTWTHLINTPLGPQ